MSTVTKKELQNLIDQVERAEGWEVKDHGNRWRITNQEGGGPIFINKRPPAGDTLKTIIDLLISRGWNETQAKEAEEAERQARLDADRARGERMLAQAEVQAARTIRQELEEIRKGIRDEFGDGEKDPSIADRRSLALIIGDGIRKEVVTIDAKFARELLTYNNFFAPKGDYNPDAHTNRPLDLRLVDEYRDAMLRDEWKQSHQGIAFDSEMRLVDGQHRLVAIVEADKIRPGITFTTEVTYDLDPEIFPVIDTGKKRTAADVLALHNMPNRLALAAAVKLVYQFENVPTNQWGRTKISTQQTLQLAEMYGEPMRKAVKEGILLGKIMIPSAASAGIYLCRKAMPGVDMEDFTYGLKSGFDLAPGDPRAALRGFMERLRSQRRRTSNNVEQLGLFIKTWNHYVEGRPMYQARLRANEGFPLPIRQGNLSDIARWEAKHGPDDDDVAPESDLVAAPAQS